MIVTPSPTRSLTTKQVASRTLTSRLASVLVPAPVLLGLVAFALALPTEVSADEPDATTPTTPTTTVAPPPPSEAPTPGAVTTTPAPAPAPATPGPTEAGTETGPEAGPQASAGGPQVEAQHAQNATPGGSSASGKTGAHSKKQGKGTAGGAGGQPQTTGGTSGSGPRANHRAPSPSELTPTLPLTLGGSIAGVPGFFVESFQIPPFLLPIYQAAGTAYGIPWQVLAAINEVETDYGRDLSVSSAGAEGWMQFLPSTWVQYGVDANGDGFKDPYNPADAIFAAARYLRAAGGDANVRAAVYSYNHSQAYVDSVMLRAQLLGGTPPELLGAVTGLTEARFPVHASSHYSDGFSTIPARGSSPSKALVGTTIYSQVGAPVIAAQDGEIVQIGDSPSLGTVRVVA